MKICLIWTLIGLLVGSIPFATILTLYLKDSSAKSYTTVSNILSTLRWNTTGITVAGVTGQTSNASNHLRNPWGLYIDPFNTLYIADRWNNRIQKYTKDASFGETVAGQASGLNDSGPSFLFGPIDVQVDLNGDIYIADGHNHRVQLWSRGSSSGITIAGTGAKGSALDRLSYPYGIARDNANNGIYISDNGNRRIMFYSAGSLNGTVITRDNPANTNDSQLYMPLGLHFDIESNSLLIANWEKNNSLQWMLSTSQWTLITGYLNKTSSDTPNGARRPADVITDPLGNIYIADFDNHRIQFFPVGERLGSIIAGITGLVGNNASLFRGTASIALDTQLNLYVSDYYNHRVQKFLRY